MKMALFAIAAVALAQTPATYEYGPVMPPIACSPDHLTTILLQSGEEVITKPMGSDTSHWKIDVIISGTGASMQRIVVVKPMETGISTDLLFTTNRRAYHLQLVSRQSDYRPRVDFSYPATDSWEQYRALEEAAKKVETKASVPQPVSAPLPVQAENCAYTVNSKPGIQFAPVKVCDIKGQTYITMPAEARNWDAPILQIAGPNGCEITNYRVAPDDHNKWIVDRLFASADLASGVGKDAQRVTMAREGLKPIKCKDIKPKDLISKK